MMFSQEKAFVRRMYQHADKFTTAGDMAVMEGFEYFTTPTFKNKAGAVKSRFKMIVDNQGIRGMLRLGRKFLRFVPSIKKNINQNYRDMEEYIATIEKNHPIQHSPAAVVDAFPNSRLWNDLKSYVWDHHKLIVGFTEVPREYVFEGKAIPFRYALIFAQEMKKDPIEKAPALDAGIEVITVYNSLGVATNSIAHWMRTNFGITCMANHPLGGLIDTVPLAAKAGLGAIGKQGLLITEKFGPRCRISPIFIDQKIFEFTDSNEHEWIHDFCVRCGSCARSCPTAAIHSEPKLSKSYQNSLVQDRYESYDREKCFSSFAATMGCAVCIRVCPFSKNPAQYDKMKKTITKG